ncbi:MAG: Co2+/Mg2+ efflux protein ApaG [Nonlabens sp.]
MIQQVTRGVRIAIKTSFEGTFYKDSKMHFAFSYLVKITNQSKDSVQLNSRHWRIMDSLKRTQHVDGEGVIGKQPVLHPGQSHTYQSGCLLNSPFGSMSGFYTMVNFTSTRQFRVTIPTFRLSAPFALN